MRSDIAPGGNVPDYELPDHTSAPRQLPDVREHARRRVGVVGVVGSEGVRERALLDPDARQHPGKGDE